MIPERMAPLDVRLNEEQNYFVHDSEEKNPNALTKNQVVVQHFIQCSITVLTTEKK
jgi:hypothetical protein